MNLQANPRTYETGNTQENEQQHIVVLKSQSSRSGASRETKFKPPSNYKMSEAQNMDSLKMTEHLSLQRHWALGGSQQLSHEPS